MPSVAENFLDRARSALGCLQQVVENSTDAVGSAYTAPSSRPARGRPKFDISRDQLGHFIETGFSVPEMSEMLGVSKRTVERRLQQFGLSIRETYSDMTDQELDEKVGCFKVDYPHAGYRIIRRAAAFACSSSASENHLFDATPKESVCDG